MNFEDTLYEKIHSIAKISHNRPNREMPRYPTLPTRIQLFSWWDSPNLADTMLLGSVLAPINAILAPQINIQFLFRRPDVFSS